MALEQIFSCRKTLARLQNGPLCDLLEGFCLWLMNCGFSRWTIRAHLSCVSHFNAYLGRLADTPREVVTAQDVEGFFRAYPLRCRNRGALEKHLRYVHGAIDRFIDYLREKGVFEPAVSSPLYQPLLDAYRTWMQQQRHVTAGTLALRCRSLSGFLRRLGARRPPPRGWRSLAAISSSGCFWRRPRGWDRRRGVRCSRRCAPFCAFA